MLTLKIQFQESQVPMKLDVNEKCTLIAFESIISKKIGIPRPFLLRRTRPQRIHGAYVPSWEGFAASDRFKHLKRLGIESNDIFDVLPVSDNMENIPGIEAGDLDYEVACMGIAELRQAALKKASVTINTNQNDTSDAGVDVKTTSIDDTPYEYDLVEDELTTWEDDVLSNSTSDELPPSSSSQDLSFLELDSNSGLTEELVLAKPLFRRTASDYMQHPDTGLSEKDLKRKMLLGLLDSKHKTSHHHEEEPLDAKMAPDDNNTMMTRQGDDVVDDDDMPPPSLPGLFRQQSYVVLDGEDDITDFQATLINEISTVLSVGESVAAVLLRAYKWNNTILVREYLTDCDKTRKFAGLPALASEITSNSTMNPDFQINVTELLRSESEKSDAVNGVENDIGGDVADGKEDMDVQDEGLLECELCYADVTEQTSKALDCKHRFCLDCWSGWIDSEFDKGAASVYSECPAYECNMLIPPDFFSSILEKQDAKKVTQYARWRASNFITTNAYIKWCPRTGCNRAVQYRKEGMRIVECECGHVFCFACGIEAHEPAPCGAARDWQQRTTEDSSLFEWMAQSQGKGGHMNGVKHCPQCHGIIEKNQGCKHMSCQACSHQFCWLCLQNWQGHDESACSSFASDQKYKEEKQSGSSKGNAMSRFHFFLSRWQFQDEAVKFAKENRALVVSKTADMHKLQTLDADEVQFLLQAADMIIKARRQLAWSYSWAFWMASEEQQDIVNLDMITALFQHHQTQLGIFTEELQRLCELPIDIILYHDMRTEIVGKTKAIEKYIRNINLFSRETR